jgi:threonine synthase
MYALKCIECGREYNPEEVIYLCECGGLLEVRFNLDQLEFSIPLDGSNLSVWKYKDLLPIAIDPVTIGEGGTPLYHCKKLGRMMGIKNLFVKHEGMNPSGSFKDRGMTVGVTKAIELNRTTVACASTGNTSASMAMYAAKAGLMAVVLLPYGKVALGKVAQAMVHGAKVLGIKDNFDKALMLVREVSDKLGFYLLNSVNPFRLEGQKTIAYEIYDVLQSVPSRVILPVGNAGNISAIYKGFREFEELGIISNVPHMIGVQAEKASPIANAVKRGDMEIIPEKNPETIATAIRIGDPVNAVKALRAIRESDGTAISVSDQDIVKAQLDLARLEGIGVEPASAASIAGLKKLAEDGIIEKDEVIVCIVTGHLLKDPEEVIDICGKPHIVEPDINAIRRAISTDK